MVNNLTKKTLIAKNRNLILSLISEKARTTPEWGKNEEINFMLCGIVDFMEEGNEEEVDAGTRQWVKDLDERLDL